MNPTPIAGIESQVHDSQRNSWLSIRWRAGRLRYERPPPLPGRSGAG